MMAERAVGLDMTWGGLETGGAFIEMIVNMDVSKLPTLEAGLIIVEMVMGKRYIMVTAGPPDLNMGEGIIFCLSQERRGGRGIGVFGSCGSFLGYNFGRC